MKVWIMHTNRHPANRRRFIAGLILLSATGCAVPAPRPTAPAIDWHLVPVVTIQLSLDFFRPSTLTLQVGESVRLIFLNGDGRTHDFVTNLFTSAAQRPGIRPGKMRVILQPQETVEYDIVPEMRGIYTLNTFMLVRPGAIPSMPIYVR